MKFSSPLLLFIFIVFSITLLKAQSPDLINYQAVARDISGNPLVSTPVNVTYDIRQSSSTGPVVYSETHSLTTNQFGLFTAEIGGGTPVSGTFAGINWSTGLYYLQVTINGDIMPATQLLSVPYALHANTATSGTPGANGHANLADSVSEPAGSNCANGGYLIHMGADDNDDGTLQALERDISYYICNGLDGSANNNDTSATNELQTLSISNDTIFLTNGGFVVLPNASGDNDWLVNGNDLSTMPTGNVGIGTTTPGRKLSIEVASTTGDGISINNSSSGNPGIEFQTQNNPRFVMGVDQSDNNKFKIGTTNLFTNTRFTISPLGDIGIGTVNPVHRLTVASADSIVASFTGANPNAAIISVANINPNAPTGAIFLTGSDSGIVAIDPSQNTFFISNTSSNGHIALSADSTVATYGKFIFNSSDAILNEADSIFSYSTNSNGVFHVNQGTFVTDSLYVVGANVTNPGWLLANDGFGQAVWTNPSSIGSSNWNINGSGIDYTAGNVGIGTTNPTSTLTINSVVGNDIEFVGGSNADIYSNSQIFMSSFSSTHIDATEIRLGTAALDRLTIVNNGNIGVGTITPQQLFTLSTPASTTLRMERTNTAAFDWEMNVDNLGFHLKGGADAVGPGLTDFVNVDGNGRMGLGITTPTQKLHVFGGTIRIDDGSNPYNLPVSDGSNGQVLTTNGAGITSWQSLSGGGNDTALIDADGDTRIQVESAPDQDVIHFNLGNSTGYTAAEYFTMIGPRLEVINSGNSVFIGQGAGVNDDLTNNLNTFVGHDAGNSNTTGVENVAIGSAALLTNTTGGFNTALGREALRMSTTGGANTAAGYRAAQNNTVGALNSAFGYEVLRFNQTGNRNTAFGVAGLQNSTGHNNTSLGADAGITLTTGDNNTFIGKSADVGTANLNNATAIGANAIVNTSNSMVLGDNNVNVGIGTSSPNNKLHINGGGITINDGTEGLGKILTSDAMGNASWKIKRVSFESEISNVFSLSVGSFGSGSQKLPFTLEMFDDGGIYDPSTGVYEFTAPVSGVYSIEAGVTFAHSGGGKTICSLALVKNGVSNTPMKTSSSVLDQPGELHSAIITATVRLAAGDKITVEAVMNASSSINIQPSPINKNWFSGHLVYEL